MANRKPNRPARPMPRAGSTGFVPKPDRDAWAPSSLHTAASQPPRPALQLNLAPCDPLPPPVWLDEKSKALGIEFDAGDVERLGLFLSCLLHANQQLNLTAITEPDKAWDRHILDSLSLVAVLAQLPEGARIIDVGTGGGLPGLPLAICMPHLRFTLLEATHKKVEFLDATIAKLALQNCTTHHARAEVAAHDIGARSDAKGGATRLNGQREQYDAVIARAVGALHVLAEITVPFAKINGLIALIKGAKAQQEIEDARQTLHDLKAVVESVVATPTGQIVILGKRVATPRLFPRAERVNSRKNKRA